MVVVKAIEAFLILAALARDAIADPASTNCEVFADFHFLHYLFFIDLNLALIASICLTFFLFRLINFNATMGFVCLWKKGKAGSIS